ncbi:hypothetical protein Q7P37_001519 [Cladosporium fusiforme]
MTSVSAQTLASSLDKLAITPEAQAPKILTNPIIPTTDDDDLSESVQNPATAHASSEAKQAQTTAIPSTRYIPSPPPPTPASPTIKTKASAFDSPYQTLPPYGMNGSIDDAAGSGNASGSGRSTPRTEPDKRPEKTTSTAARLIAAGLGKRAPRRTEEERKYDQAMRVQEKKKRDAAKAEEERKKEELEKAKRSIWED